eukprot:CAMPEP_0119378932 /NCGR_PEP_ID=MMETSP1334-20130426/50595_1 /TAXON_ID=127549 /ORGANISM="Calcidiscus leptoporus, Strain RCC1130" /LENGTH=311 /DNA_ID=CAMNT_0007398299 /DNA_START=32 /DNA_END=967 /DNA_ORIENTATION=-
MPVVLAPLVVAYGHRAAKDPNLLWVNAQDRPRDHWVVQVGANDGRPHSNDPVCQAVKSGWNAVLLEPMAAAFARLASRYSNHTLSRVRLHNAAVCPTKAQKASCQEPTMPMYYVDFTNATGNWGTAQADARCLSAAGQHSLSEISSFSRSHLMKHQRMNNPYGGRACVGCSARLNRSYPINCLKFVIKHNIRSRDVRCACFDGDAAPHDEPRGAVDVLGGVPNTSLLVIDAEGHDDEVIAAYPLGRPRARPRRVIFEAKHLVPERFRAAVSRLQACGYECVQNCNASVPTRALGVWDAGAFASPTTLGTCE